MIDTAPQAENLRAEEASDAALRWLAVAFLVCSLATVLYVRVRLLDLPLERDEGEYAYAGQLILDGSPPYLHVYNMKMPGTYLAYAATMAAFGQTPAGVHLGLLLVNLSCGVLVFLLARKSFGFSAAAASAATFGLLALSPAFLGLAAHATHFVVLFALLGVWFLLRFEERRHLWECSLGGLFFGVAFLMKQPGMFFGMFGGLYLIWVCAQRQRSDRLSGGRASWRLLFLPVLMFSISCTLPFVGVCLWLKNAGVFPQFWFWTVDYARQYVGVLSLAHGAGIASKQFILTFILATLLWVIGGLGFVVICSGRLHVLHRICWIGLIVFSFFAVCPGLYFRPHYFILLLPAAALMVAAGLEFSQRWLAVTPWSRVLPLVIVAAGCAQTLVLYGDTLFKKPLAEVSSSIYPDHPFVAAPVISQHIAPNTSPEDRIVVIGSEPEIYFYAHRQSSTGYIYTYPLMEPQLFARKMQAQMIQEIEKDPPVYLVFVSVQNSISSIYYWDSEPRRALFDWVSDYVSRNMHLEGMILLDNGRVSNAAWGVKAGELAPSGSYLAVYRKNDR